MRTSPYTSTLGVGELLAARRAGLRPLGQVMGSCVYHVGWQRMPTLAGLGTNPQPWSGYDLSSVWTVGGYAELDVQTQAWNEARRLALSRLREHARSLGALAVVDVAYRRLDYDWGQGTIEIVAIGTAVGSDTFDVDPDEEELALVNLPGEDWTKLVAAGWWPTGIVGGSTVVYVLAGVRSAQAQWIVLGTAMQNQELEDYTAGLYESRDLALRRLRDDARDVGATGILGVTLDHHLHVHRDESRTNLVVTMHALGTGVAAVAGGELPQIYYALNLKGSPA